MTVTDRVTLILISVTLLFSVRCAHFDGVAKQLTQIAFD